MQSREFGERSRKTGVARSEQPSAEHQKKNKQTKRQGIQTENRERERERAGEGQRRDRNSRGQESRSGKALHLNVNESFIRC